MEEPIKVCGFDGFISSVSGYGEQSEVIVYVSQVVSDDLEMSDQSSDSHLVDSNDNHLEEIYTIRLGQCVERVTVKEICDDGSLIKVHLIDKGIDVKMERATLFPCTSQDKPSTGCVCPVLVSDAGNEQRVIASYITGHGCRCINGNLFVSSSVGVCVKGRLLISYENGGYVELKDISMASTKKENPDFFIASVPMQLTVDTSSTSACENSSESRCELLLHRKCDADDGKKSAGSYGSNLNPLNTENSSAVEVLEKDMDTFTESRTSDDYNEERFDKTSKTNENNVHYGENNHNKNSFNGKIHQHHQKVQYSEQENGNHIVIPTPDMTYKQRAFKEYLPHTYPCSLRIRFHRIDRTPKNTFWAFDPNIFTTIEKTLHEKRMHYSTYPHFDFSKIHKLNGVGCLVRANVDNGYRSFCRAEIIDFVDSIERFSVYLVDYGFYKWIKYSDAFDISSVKKKDRILHLPVSLLHCRIESGAGFRGIHLRDFERGCEYEMVIRSRGGEGIFNVSVERNNEHLAGSATMCFPTNSANFNSNDSFAPFFSSLKYINETIARTLDKKMNIERSMHADNIVNRSTFNKAPFNNRSNFYGVGVICPLMMPILVPIYPNTGDATRADQSDQISNQVPQRNDAHGKSIMAVNSWECDTNNSIRNEEQVCDSNFCSGGCTDKQIASGTDRLINSDWNGGGNNFVNSNRKKHRPFTNSSISNRAPVNYSLDDSAIDSFGEEIRRATTITKCAYKSRH